VRGNVATMDTPWTMEPEWQDDPTDNTVLVFALGSVVEQSARMEWVLRSAFCVLVGSKYAAIIAGGQPLTWLLDNCKALVRANLEMTQEQIADIDAALTACSTANERRNVLVHGLSRPGDEPDGLEKARSRRRTDVPHISQWTVDTIDEVGYQLVYATGLLLKAIQSAMGLEAMGMGRALARERERLEQAGHGQLHSES
jgi:hypothetical protein